MSHESMTEEILSGNYGKFSEAEVNEAKILETKMRTEKQTYFHLLGKTGSGRSATGNTILGRKSFSTKSSFSAVTTSIQMESPEDRPDIVVVDGPGLVGVNTGLSDEAVKAFGQVVEGNQNAEHVFLVICRYGERFTEEEEEMVTRLKEEFGGQRALENHAIVVLTCGDNFERDTEDEDLTFEQWCKQQTGAFRDLRKWCKDRVVAVDNNKREGLGGTSFLYELEKIIQNIKGNRGKYLMINNGHEEMKHSFLMALEIGKGFILDMWNFFMEQ